MDKVPVLPAKSPGPKKSHEPIQNRLGIPLPWEWFALEPVEQLEIISESDLLAGHPGLLLLLAHYQMDGKPVWMPRRRREDLHPREEQRLHAIALAEGWLEPSGGNPDAPLELRETACYKLTRAGKSAIQNTMESAA